MQRALQRRIGDSLLRCVDDIKLVLKRGIGRHSEDSLLETCRIVRQCGPNWETQQIASCIETCNDRGDTDIHKKRSRRLLLDS